MKAILLLLVCLPLQAMDILLINGEVVTGESQIVNIRTGNSGCTATVIGKKVIITAAHCASTGATSTFKVNNVSYSAKMTRAPLYPGKDHDICLGLVNKDVDTKPSSVVGRTQVLSKGQSITFFGYGCIKPGGGGGNDGKLRKGSATVTGFSNYDVVSSQGAALCYGDSGGPGYMLTEPAVPMKLVSINSKGNISTTNYTTRLDITESQEFMKAWATTNNASICGVTMNCDEVIPPPPPPPPPPGDFQFVLDGETAQLKVKTPINYKLTPFELKTRLKMIQDALDKVKK